MDAISRRLLFRIGKIGFCLYLNDLVEIRDQAESLIDYTQGDHPRFILGALNSRQARIPVVDLAGRLGLEPPVAGNVLILSSREGNWALLADRVEGFCAAMDMKDLLLPQLLRAEGWRCFQQVSMYQGEPFLCLDLPACYGGER
jgi:chemotaxis signal transduction protein